MHTTVFDFDAVIDRKNTDSLKWERYRDRDILPLWVADMDFLSPPAVIQALRERVEHGVFGYTLPPADLVEVVIQRLFSLYGWTVDPSAIVFLPGIVTGLNLACRCVGQPGNAVITTVPIYPPFLSSPGVAGRERIDVPMIDAGHRWEVDWDRLEEAARRPSSKLLNWCSPHNPTGRVFEKQELERAADICLRNGLVLCSDEIHCDLILTHERRHQPVAALGSEIENRSITLMAPSKTFNIAGLGCSFAVIPDAELRVNFKRAAQEIVPHVNLLAFTAALAAYRGGADWLEQLLVYLRGNHQLVLETVNALPGLSMKPVEGTYLAWIDTRGAGLEKPARFFEEAGVGLSDGAQYGDPESVRLNFGCPRAILKQALERIASSIRQPAITGS
jgi:cystathionine beta-lyase